MDRGSAGRLRQDDLFVGGEAGYYCYRIPSLIVSSRGTLLALCEARRDSCRDDADIDLFLRRSLDNGETWQPVQILADDSENTMGNPCPVVDRDTGAIHLFLCRNNRRAFVMTSHDDGETFSEPREMTAVVRDIGVEWTRLGTGPGHGIQLRSGRLIIPVWLMAGALGQPTAVYQTGVVYSDDHGTTWRPGGVVPPTIADCNEAELVQTADGRLCLSLRNKASEHQRAFAWSDDEGETWSEPQLQEALTDSAVMAGIHRLTDVQTGDRNRVLFSNPDDPEGRTNLTIRLSYDECQTWPVARVLNEGPSGYSDLAVAGDGTICCLYERGTARYNEKLTFARFDLTWLTNGEDRLPAAGASSLGMEFRKFGGNPVVMLGERDAWDSHNIFAPMAVKHGGRYRLYYSGGPNGPGKGTDYTDYQIGVAVSDRGLHFKKHPANPLIPLGERDNFHAKPAILRDAHGGLLLEDGLWRMWFNGNRANDVEYATSEDGINWRKYTDNPVFRDAYAPTVIKDGQRYRMWYTMGQYGAFRIGYAQSPDGITWTPAPQNPVMEPRLPWEMGNVFYPFAVKMAGEYVLFYTVMGGQPHQCNLAMATSRDGLEWPEERRRLILTHGEPGEWDGVYASCPCLVPEPDGRHRLYYAGRIDMIHKYFAIGLAMAELGPR